VYGSATSGICGLLTNSFYDLNWQSIEFEGEGAETSSDVVQQIISPG
jgi:hypothetical protein